MDDAPVTTISLNDAQRSAVEHPAGPLLVLAGAGSGKTRVLTERIARLVREGVPPHQILAFTFTNRAAKEMRERIERAVGEPARKLWMGTFHGTGLRILRREVKNLGPAARHPNFVVYDREDQEKVLDAVMKRIAQPPEDRGKILNRISDWKSRLMTPAEAGLEAMQSAMSFPRCAAECYQLYRDALQGQGAFDFDDLIAEPVWLFRRAPDIAAAYAKRFQHVLVDEYQDTNHSQFRMVEQLARGHGNIFVVGDDDQSIYGFRGADLSNVLDFESAFPGATLIRLEQNYRSTGNILAAANAVIANNQSRKGKTLWCERDAGAPLQFVLARDDGDEAQRVAAFVEGRARRAGGRLADCAVLYRTHAQSRAIETEFRRRGIAYQLVGGVSFYQRREVKDLLAYLRLAVNPTDATAFWRVLNTPKRGLGDAVRTRIEARLQLGAAHPLAALREVVAAREISRGSEAAAAFVTLIDELTSRAGESPAELLATTIERTGYLGWLEGQEQGEERQANVAELVGAATAFAEASSEPGLAAYVSEAALLTDGDRLEEGADRVLLLTAHNAKGLEFKAVIVAGLEEGLFPHASSLQSTSEIEEERRLFYVAVTRAQEHVLLTAAARRMRYSAAGGFGAMGGQVSRFVEEIPSQLLERDQPVIGRSFSSDDDDLYVPPSDDDQRPHWERPEAKRWREPAPAWTASVPRRRGRGVGREVYHEDFGRGVVVAIEGSGGDARYTVRFGTRLKKILGRFLTEGSHVE
jgi:DNA helicase-2/ATP-dependent DNA helicase PcrA